MSGYNPEWYYNRRHGNQPEFRRQEFRPRNPTPSHHYNDHDAYKNFERSRYQTPGQSRFNLQVNNDVHRQQRPPRALPGRSHQEQPPKAPPDQSHPQNKTEDEVPKTTQTSCAKTTDPPKDLDIISPESPEAQNDEEPPVKRSKQDEPQPIPLYRESDPMVGGELKLITCRLCNNAQSFKTDYDFKVHLTMIHYKDSLQAKVKSPYECTTCGYSSPQNFSDFDKEEDLIVHYGCNENLAMQLYEEECAKLPEPQQGPTIQEIAKIKNKIICKLCKEPSLHNERMFLRHLTMRHFDEEIKARIPQREPFICPVPGCDIETEGLHYLALHYGSEHNYSQTRYDELLGEKPKPKEPIEISQLPVPALPTADDHHAVDSDRISALYAKKKVKDIDHKPPTLPSDATNGSLVERRSSDASASSSTEHKRKRHHSSSHHHHRKHKSSKREDPPKLKQIDMFAHKPKTHSSDDGDITCPLCQKDSGTFANKKSLQYHQTFSHFCPNVRSKSTNFKCPKCSVDMSDKKTFFKHFMSLHFKQCLHDFAKDDDTTSNDGSLTDTPLPASRTRQTYHDPTVKRSGPKTVRQKMQEEWKKSSIENISFERETLKNEITKLKAEHAEELRKKDESFERWITSKESALETEEANKKLLQERLEQAHVDVSDLRKQLELQQESYKNLEAMLVDTHSKCKDITEENTKLQSRVDELDREIVSANFLGEKYQSDAEIAEKKVKTQKEELEELEASVSEKEDKITSLEKDMKWEKANNEKASARLEKQVESHKNKVKLLTEEKKKKDAVIKDLNARLKGEEIEHKNQLKQLEDANESLKNVPRKDKKITDELSSKNDEITQLKSQKSNLLDALEKLQRTMTGYDELYAAKNKEISDLTNQKQELNLMLEETTEELEDMKGCEKEKKELQKKIKTLQKESKTWEEKQFSLVRLISGLEKEKAELKERVTKSESNKSGSEAEVKDLNAKVKKLTSELTKIKGKRDSLETELARGNSRFQSKVEEVNGLQSKLRDQDDKIRSLEREVRDNQSTADSSKVHQSLQNKEAELLHLRKSLEQTRMEAATRKQALDHLGSRLNVVNQDLQAAQSEKKDLKERQAVLRDSLRTAERKMVKMDEIQDLLKQPLFGNTHLEKVTVFLAGNAQLDSNYTRMMVQPILDGLAKVIETSKLSELRPTPTDVPKIKTEKIEPDEQPLPPPPPPPPPPLPLPVKTSTVDAQASSIIYRVHNMSEVVASGETTESDQNIAEEASSDASDDIEIGNFFEEPPPSQGLVFNHNVPPAEVEKQMQAKKSKRTFEDVTGRYDAEEDDITCEICHQYDPPAPEGQDRAKGYRTDWVGCNCGRWFHKSCARQFCKRITASFACKSVKMRCIGRKAKAPKSVPSNKSKKQSNLTTIRLPLMPDPLGSVGMPNTSPPFGLE